MNIAVIGPPGAGKGTHTKKLSLDYDLHYLSTGELLRENLEKRTGLGFMAQGYMDRGELVPNEVVDGMIVEHLRNIDADTKLLFNGFPRTTYQAQFLDELFEDMGRGLDAVIYLKAADDEIVNRLSQRLICGQCQAPFHKTFHPFKTCPYNKCDGEHLYQRRDDNPRMARARLSAFRRVTGPLINYYLETDRLYIIDGEGSIEDIDDAMAEIVQAVVQHQAQPSTREEAKQLSAARQSTKPTPVQETYPSYDLIFLGAPGAGKGTQAEQLSQHFNIPRIATGDLLRENIENETELGKIAKGYMDHGKLVPDDVAEELVRERLTRDDVRDGFILDGFPRNTSQAEALADILLTLNRQLEGVLYLSVSDEEIIRRLSGRKLCRECQAPFHATFNPFKACPYDKCQGEFLYQRVDDKPETVRARLRIFHRETEPLVDYYRRHDLLVEIDGEGELSKVTEHVMGIADELKQRQLNREPN